LNYSKKDYVESVGSINFPDLIKETLARPVSDYFPPLLESGKVEWGHSLFRFEKWLAYPNFSDLINGWWEEYRGTR